MAEVLSVDVSAFFQMDSTSQKIVFSPTDSLPLKLPDVSADAVSAHLLTPVGSIRKLCSICWKSNPDKRFPVTSSGTKVKKWDTFFRAD